MDNTKKDNSKRHHYVPVFYLKEFGNCFNNKSDVWKIWVYDKEERKSFYTNIDEIFSKNYFYRFLEDEENNNVFDLNLQSFESEFAPFLKTFLNKINKKVRFNQLDNFIFKKSIKKKFSKILAVQLMRTTKTREFLQLVNDEKSSITNKYVEEQINFHINAIEEQCPNIGNKFLEFAKDYWKNTINEYRQIYQKNPAKGHYSYFDRNLKSVQKEFYSRNWLIGLNKTNKTFYTSDNPVLFIDNGNTILFPLNSETILILQINNSFLRSSSQIVNLEKVDIESFNREQLSQSKRHICCKNNDFELVRSHRL